jgi:dTDP-4-amino-2,4-dideoxy-beta-L-xylose N-methyltransferase
MYGAEFAEVYDLLYGSRKDYAAEAGTVSSLIVDRLPDARSLLDVGCGTAEHLKHWSKRFDTAGVEGSAGMVEVARRKLPEVHIEHADMRTFDLGRTFDVVCSMYGCVGYLDELHTALARMAAHVRPGGLLLFEPWITRENWTGHLDVDDLTVRDGRRLARMGNWVTAGDTVSIDLHYLYGDAGEVRHFVDRQRLTLFGYDDYLGAAKEVLGEVEFLPESPSGRGMFIGVR